MIKNNKSGYTLVEVLVVIVVIFVILGIGFVKAICQGNFWFTEEGALRELRADHPKVTEIMKIERNIFSYSVITVREDGEARNYDLDSNALFNYTFSAQLN